MLTNCLLGRKITAVSAKVNTTTSQTFGVLTSKNIQLTVFDTPGVVDHLHYKDMKQRERVSDAYATAALCDALVFVVDAERQMRRPDPRVERLLLEYKEELKNFDEENKQTPTSILALSKVDLIDSQDKGNLLEMAKQLSDLGSFDKIFMISSLRQMGTNDLVDYLKSVSQTRKWNMNENDSSHNHETLAMELVKEQVYRRLNGEIPYELKISPVSCKFLRDGSLRIEQDLLVNHMKKKKIVVGKRGQAIGQIGCRARAELEKCLNLKVHLILNVKVRKQ
jgi:GTP-binding protein Era